MSSLKYLLEPIPQSPVHHPEGSVWNHTRMVRKSLRMALQASREAFKGVSCFSCWGDSFSKEEINILRASAWMHDIGKSVTTFLNLKGRHIYFSDSPLICKALAENEEGRWQALEHDRMSNVKKALRRLKGSSWERIWKNADFEAKKDFLFLLRNHMKLHHAKAKRTYGFGRKLSRKWIDTNGEYKNKRRVKLLIVLIMMDSLGRDVPEAKYSVNIIIGFLVAGAKFVKNHPKLQSEPAPNDPHEFLSLLRNKPEKVIRQAFLGKFGRELTKEEFKEWQLQNNKHS